ncbi:YphA family membrane protein [Alkalihalobacterium elongatum]|uniref:YphA family membrane protein n=1 Tax=Alkalihalobacterium elongatum TaxID=2675466 RepID=UPI001C1FA1B4|nr:hypothetical protein [Alkalihalobacterium elongatum]
MEGILFIWLIWICWIICTFYFKKSKKRTWFSFWLLVVIILFNKTFSTAMYEISLGYLTISILCYWFIAKNKSIMIIYMLFISTILTFLYAGLHLVELYDPVMFLIVDKIWVISIIGAIITLVLTKDLQQRLVISLSGLIQGELLFKKFLSTIYGIQTIGEASFFDIIALCFVFIIGWHVFEQFCEFMGHYVRKLPSSNEKDIRVFR